MKERTIRIEITANGNDLEIFRVDEGRTAEAAVVCAPESDEIGLELSLSCGVKCSEGARHGAVVLAEEVDDDIGRERIFELVVTVGAAEVENAFAEAFVNRRLIAPENGGGHSIGCNVAGDDFKHLANEALGCPVSHRDLAARLADAEHL